jgi:hypothetical protein
MADQIRRESMEQRSGSQAQPGIRPGAEARDGRSIPDLLKELTTEGRTLVSEEVRLAKAEFSEKLEVFQRNLASIGVGVALLVATVILVVEAAARGLTALLADPLGLEMAVWVAPLILAVLIGLVGWGLIRKGTTALKKEGVVPRETVDTLKRDAQWAERKVKA